MAQHVFTPPSRDPEMDILQHLWATKHAISSWEIRTPKFIEIRVSEYVAFLLKVHPRLHEGRLTEKSFNSVWGIPFRVDLSMSDDPGYTFIYTRAE